MSARMPHCHLRSVTPRGFSRKVESQWSLPADVKVILLLNPSKMAFVESQASSSRRHSKKGREKPVARVKTNQAKRDKVNEELKELKTKIDNYVSAPMFLTVS